MSASASLPADDRYACDDRFPGLQVVRLMRRAIERQRLDLTGLRVLTEASVGYRRVTPVIAALAGAEEVYAISRDSARAGRRDADEQTAYLAALAGASQRVKLLPTRLQAPLATVDIVTDLPGVRPVDDSILRNLSGTAAVALMGGVDRWRAADLDVATCRRTGIAVAGVDEEAIGLCRYAALQATCGLAALGVDVVGSTIVVAGGGRRYGHVTHGLAAAGARVLVVTPDNAGRVALYGGEKIADRLADAAVPDRLADADGLVLCPAADEEPAARGEAAGRLASAAPHLSVVAVREADRRALSAAGLRCWPVGGGDDLPDEMLPRPLIERHIAGLKVAEVMTRARRRGSSPLAAEQLAASDAHAELLPKDLLATRR